MVDWYWLIVAGFIGFIIGRAVEIIKSIKNPTRYLSKQDKVDLKMSKIHSDPC